jgi:hypothetical protein
MSMMPGEETMRESDHSVQCPYCGEPGSLEVEPTAEPGEQVFVEDCAVCCRPWTVRVHTDAEGQLEISVEQS